ncbi:MAG: mucoidy inhibitor MuiA family protein [Phycisphaerae bacterium]|nr:mucoidy inhibitor MuiA family protein [Phycisphaerae bacterium]NIP53233.1 mucoidy inhibitor MuiA family protein [Phycisphaerae bacterium]NIS52259.1 mucoidy inhibitor MuiA family protein [Phycisphaerae bacterium]NIU09805.1 mucoidy inhibitor MuiA family protein [Phycisphaerae bacterium]NIU59443.1 mucoidy inhibitor MuiA family protein [Phycisphaerae bacterium]
MKQHNLLLMLAVIVLVTSAAFADAQTTTGTISKVTVYRGQALVTRTLDVDLPAGTSELIVTNLPAKIVPESLYAQASGDIKVLSVRFRERAVREDTREEVKKLDAQIEEAKRKLKHATKERENATDLWNKFKDLWKMAIDGANVDLNRSVMQSEQIESYTKYLESKSLEWNQKILELQDTEADLTKELELLTRKRKELDAGHSRTEREAVVFVSSKTGNLATIELSYLVNGANWNPQYNLRANPKESDVLIEYNAVVNQTSGEDWDGIALSLSTAEPTMVSAPPVLDPMLVSLSAPQPTQQAEQQAFVQLENVRRQLQSRRANIKKGIAANVDLNELAISNQAFVLQAGGVQVKEFQKQLAVVARKEGVSVTYNLPGKLSLPSRSDQQLVTIASLSTKADFTLIATPILTDYVYLQAELLNDSDTILLPGKASVFRNGEFVGNSQLPLVTIGEKLTAGFGIDSQVQVTHELEDKKTRIQGGNRIDTYNYSIALSNYKNTAVELQLLDRLGYTEDSSIKIDLVKTEPQLSEDSEYLRTARKKGILRWDLNLQPNTVDEDATIVKYSFTMEYDKNMRIQARRK